MAITKRLISGLALHAAEGLLHRHRPLRGLPARPGDADAGLPLEGLDGQVHPQPQAQGQGGVVEQEPHHLVEVGLLHRPDVGQQAGRGRRGARGPPGGARPAGPRREGGPERPVCGAVGRAVNGAVAAGRRRGGGLPGEAQPAQHRGQGRRRRCPGWPCWRRSAAALLHPGSGEAPRVEEALTWVCCTARAPASIGPAAATARSAGPPGEVVATGGADQAPTPTMACATGWSGVRGSVGLLRRASAYSSARALAAAPWAWEVSTSIPPAGAMARLPSPAPVRMGASGL